MTKPRAPTQPNLLAAVDDPATQTPKFDKIIRIAVTGDVFLTELERLVIDTPDFQRLKRIRQLGTVSYVFPTALHTRFDHSLGTLAMADRMVTSIVQNAASSESERYISTTQRLLVRLYGLLHDIPHIPFGHTLEDELRLYQRHDENPTRINRFLGPDSEIAMLIKEHEGAQFYDRLLSIFLWEDGEDKREARKNSKAWAPLKQWLRMEEDDLFAHDLVSNTVCADLLDYIARDNYFCNLGIWLEYRFLNFLYLKVPEWSSDNKRRVFIRLWKGRNNKPRRDTLTDLARLLEARYMIAERAYFHHTKIVTGIMLGRALQESTAANELTEEDLYMHSDDTLLARTCDSKAEVACELGGKLRNRQLYKVVEKFDQTAFQQAQETNHDETFRDNALKSLGDPSTRKQIEDSLAEEVGAQPGWILIYAPPFSMNMKVARMNVRWKGKDMVFSEIDDPVIKPRLEQILSAHQLLWGIWVIGIESLTEDQKALVLESFKLRFLVSNDAQKERRVAFVAKLIQAQMAKDKVMLNLTSDKLDSRTHAAAEEFLKTATDKRSHRARLRSAIEKIVKDKA